MNMVADDECTTLVCLPLYIEFLQAAPILWRKLLFKYTVQLNRL